MTGPRLYRTADGKRVPGVTTVIGGNLGWNKESLMHWANAEGLEGRHHRDTSQKAADIGTTAHAMIEAELKGIDWRQAVDLRGVTPEMIAKAENAVGAWHEWRGTVNFSLLGSEVPLVSEAHNYGGTIDVAAVKRVTSIVDLKTSNGIYPDHLIQVAAYGQLWNEHHPEDPICAYYILQLGKEDGSFHYHYWRELDVPWRAFLHLLGLHELKRLIRT